MGQGLQRARAAARATRTAKCHVCGNKVLTHLESGRMPQHGPRTNRCAGSGELPENNVKEPE